MVSIEGQPINKSLWMFFYPVVFTLHMNHYCVFFGEINKFSSSTYDRIRTLTFRRQTSESDVLRRQILTYKVDPRTEKNINIYNGRRPMTYRYGNEAERGN